MPTPAAFSLPRRYAMLYAVGLDRYADDVLRRSPDTGNGESGAMSSGTYVDFHPDRTRTVGRLPISTTRRPTTLRTPASCTRFASRARSAAISVGSPAECTTRSACKTPRLGPFVAATDVVSLDVGMRSSTGSV